MHWQTQRNLGRGMLVAFVASVVILWLVTPVRTLITEKLLGNIALSGEGGLDQGFGAFPELVKDRGGSQPVPLEADAPLRTPEYRGVAWLRMQDARGWTLQVMSLSDERAVGNFLATRADRGRFVYFKLPQLPDPAQPDAPVNMRYVVSYGSFASRDEAVSVAAALGDLPGAVLPRSWGSYQAIYAAMPEPKPVSLTPPAPPQAAEPVLEVPAAAPEPAPVEAPVVAPSAEQHALNEEAAAPRL